MNKYSIVDKVMIITGGTKGMGLATARRCLALGAKVVVVYAHEEAQAERVDEEFSKSYGNNYLVLHCNITKPSHRKMLVEQCLKKFGKINVLVNNAGVAGRAGFMKESEEDFDFILDVNLKAPIFLARAVAEQMIEQGEGGSIINFASISGHRGAGAISYDAAKAGLIRATQTMANALGKYGIRVNSISPGTHKTEMNRYHWENETELYKRLLKVTPLQRAAEAEEIAGTAVYLASDQSSFTTGADILVDGGYMATLPGRK